MSYEKFMMSALSRVKTIKLLFWYHKRVRNSVTAGIIFSQTSITFARDLEFVRNSGVSAKRELTMLLIYLDK